MTLVRREPRSTYPAVAAGMEPFSVMRNLLRWDPFRDMELPEIQSGYLPPFDIIENAKGFVFTADLPGVDLETLDINLTGNRLTISGRREAPARLEGENLFTAERSFGAFTRTFSLPDGVDASNVKAELKQGVLRVEVPKVPEVQPRRISITAG